MIKKNIVIFFLLPLLNNYQPIISMEKTIDYEKLFTICTVGFLNATDYDIINKITNFLTEHPNANINYQNSLGTTLTLNAASWDRWEVVWHLLNKRNADKTIKDNYGQSVFSKAVYDNSERHFKRILTMYTPKQIHNLCKTICLDQVHGFSVANVLTRENTLEYAIEKHDTALWKSCLNLHIPIIIQLLKKGAHLHLKNNNSVIEYNTPYNVLTSFTGHTLAPLFVIRQALIEDIWIPAMPIFEILEKGKSFQNNLVPEIIDKIKQTYVETNRETIFSSGQAQIWKPVCIEVCRLNDIQTDNVDHCLAYTLLLSKERKTKINIKLALQDK